MDDTLPGYVADAKGMLKPEERQALAYYARIVATAAETALPVIVNIGVEYGASLACLRYGAAASFLYGIDLNTTRDVSQSGAILIQTDSQAYVEQWRIPIDLLFIDGDHRYEGVLNDLRYANYVRPNGFVLLHDCYDWMHADQPARLTPGIMEAVDAWRKDDGNPDRFRELTPIGTMRIFQRLPGANSE
jgi:cephalosporin hydroxylase